MTEEKALAKTQPKSLREYMRSDEITTRFAEVVGKQNANGFISSVLIAAASNEDIQKCEMKSIVSSALRAATLQLSVDPATGYAYLVPYGNQANLIVGYKGLYQMAIRTGKYRAINVFEVWEGEEPIEDRFTGFWSIGGVAKNKEKPIGIMGYFELFPNWKQGQKEGYRKFLYMTMAEIEAHAKKFSKGFDSTRAGNVWKTNRRSMEKKTVLRLLLTRWADLSGVSLEDIDADGDYNTLPDPGVSEEKPMSKAEVNKAIKDMGFEPDVLEGQFEEEKPVVPPEPDPEPEPESVKETPPVVSEPGGRPFEAKYLRKRIVEGAMKFKENNAPAVEPKERNKIITGITNLFAGTDEAKELGQTVLEYLTGTKDPANIDDEWFLALKGWLGLRDMEGEIMPSGHACAEATKIIEEMKKGK